jgi:hypothetical protein
MIALETVSTMLSSLWSDFSDAQPAASAIMIEKASVLSF